MSDTIDVWPAAYLNLQKFRQRKASSKHRIISKAHHLVIEAFPRSGSSFAHRAFLNANPTSRHRVATHLHRSSQILRAEKLGVPILVIVREPEAAVKSLLALTVMKAQLPALDGAEQRSCLNELLLRYARFSERIMPVQNMVVASFESVTSDFGRVIERVNSKFGTEFNRFHHDQHAVSELFARGRDHLSPAVERENYKKELTEAYLDASISEARKRAEEAFFILSERTLS